MGKIGYARVSTTDQDLSLQLAALSAAGCGVIRSEKITGSTVTGRAELRTVLDFIGKGDTLVVTRIDRLARSLGDLQDIVRELKAKEPRSLPPSSRSTPAPPPSRPSSTCSGLRRVRDQLRRERQMEGIAKAKAAGVYKGGKTRIEADEVRRLAGEGGWVPQPLPGNSGLAGPASTACSARARHQHRAVKPDSRDIPQAVAHPSAPRWGSRPRARVSQGRLKARLGRGVCRPPATAIHDFSRFTSLRGGGIGLFRPAAAGRRSHGFGLHLCPSSCGLIAPDLAKAKALGELGALRGVGRGDHRVVVRQAPLLTVLVGGQAARRQMALERLVGLTILKADDVVRGNRLADWNRRCGLLCCRHQRYSQLHQSRMSCRYEVRQLGRRNVVLRDVGTNDVGGETDEIGILLCQIIHVRGPNRHFSAGSR